MGIKVFAKILVQQGPSSLSATQVNVCMIMSGLT